MKSLRKASRKTGVATEVSDCLTPNADSHHSNGVTSSPDTQKLQDISSMVQSLQPKPMLNQPFQSTLKCIDTSDKEKPGPSVIAQPIVSKEGKKTTRPSRLAAIFDSREDNMEGTNKMDESAKLPLQIMAASASLAPPLQDCRHAHEIQLPKPWQVGDGNHKHKSDPPHVPRLNLTGCFGNHEANALGKIDNQHQNRNSSAHAQVPLKKNESSLRQAIGEKEWQDGSQVEKVKSLLKEKKMELDQSRQEENERVKGEIEACERRAAEREEKKAAKLKEDRKAAIIELHRRREEKKARAEQLAQIEMVRNCRLHAHNLEHLVIHLKKLILCLG